MKTRTRVALVAGAALAGALAIAACDDTIRSHIFAAAQYQPSAGCIGAYTAVDVVDGDDTGSTCAPVCLANGGVYYVSTMCPPYPALYTVSAADAGADAAADPICAAAFAAYAAGTRCAADGGTEGGDGGSTDAASESSTGGDGGADGASSDASPDAAADAPIDAPIDAPAAD